MSRVDLLYVAWNRLEFTRESFTALVAHTDWRLVRRLTIWDDGSTDGTAEWLRGAAANVPVATRVENTALGSPVSVMAQFARGAEAPIVAKIDNDTMVPPGWLGECVAILDAHPGLSLLAIEALEPHASGPDVVRTYTPAPVVPGMGVYRRDAFAASVPAPIGRWFGWQEWLTRQSPPLHAGWAAPALPVFVLDRVPLEPWRSLTRRYVALGWQRAWPEYGAAHAPWHWHEPLAETTQGAAARRDGPFDVVILSANAANLVACVQAVRAQHPDLDPSRVIVVDDGARREAEARLPGIRWVEGARPFVFARNANAGIAASARDVVLLNDDALAVTPGGFDALADAARATPGLGLLSSAVRGFVGNPRQKPQEGGRVRQEPRTVCFIAVYIPRATIDRVGPLDERFTGYGFEDDDYCDRVRASGLTLGVYDGCVVDHSGRLPSTFRTHGAYGVLAARNRRLYRDKRDGATAEPRILCAMRVKNEARFIAESLASVAPLCARTVVFDDRSADDTVAIARSAGPQVEVIESPFDGLDEARDKNFVLSHLRRLDPDWVLWIDGDEVLERRGPDALRALVSRAGAASVFTLRIAYLWDTVDRVRIDGIFGRFRRASLFRLRGQPARAQFRPTRGVNLHCGNVPAGLRGGVRHAAVRLKHYGYLSPEERRRKYEWYTQVDPGNAAEDYYRHINGVPGARHAPGPPVLEPWHD